MEKVTKESFLSNVAEHKLEVLLDNGLYRHLKVRNPNNCNQWYQITTWPDYLCISGDMGCFTFQRTEDMFQFFRRADLYINTGYWAEKIRAGADYMSAKGTHSKFDIDEAFKYVNKFMEDLVDDGDDQDDLDDEFRFVLNSADEHEFIEALRETDIDLGGWPDFYEFTYHYKWCCYAIAHAINLYDQTKQSN